MEQKTDLTFSTPIYQSLLGDLDDNRQRIIDLVLDEERRDSSGIMSSNFDGWHSGRDKHLSDQDDAKWLMRRISIAASIAIRKLDATRHDSDLVIKECWYNIHRNGAWNMPHTHPAWWSGVLYISGDFAEEGGDIMFFNPAPQSRSSGYPDHKIIKPKSGLLLLFPGYLSHMVTPYKGTEPRITVAFNIDLVSKV